MIHVIRHLFETIHYGYFFLSAVLFLAGIYVAPTVVEKNLLILLRYPRWMRRWMERILERKFHFILLFLGIFLLNNISLFFSFLSGFLIIGPPVAAFLTGLNVAVMSYEMMGWRGIWQILVNPIAWLEFPAAWISFALGFRLTEAWLKYQNWFMVEKTFFILLPTYFQFVSTLLLVAALLESGLIVLAERLKEEDGDGDSGEP